MAKYYSDEEIKQQLSYMQRARGVTEYERIAILAKLESRIADEGPFSWVKCPVWRHRLYLSAAKFAVDADQLNRIMRYVLEGEHPAMQVEVQSRSA